MDESERRARLIELVEGLRELADDTVILVEGQRDVDALRLMGVTGRVEAVNRGRTIVERAESLAEGARRIVVLTDWDRSGGTIARSVKRVLEGSRAEIDLDTRRELAYLVGSEAKTVEALPAAVARAYADKAAVDIAERRKAFARLRERRQAG